MLFFAVGCGACSEETPATDGTTDEPSTSDDNTGDNTSDDTK